MEEKITKPVKIELTLTPQVGKAAEISLQVFLAKGDTMSMDVFIFIFNQVFASLLKNGIDKCQHKDIGVYAEKVLEYIRGKEKKVKSFAKLRKMFNS